MKLVSKNIKGKTPHFWVEDFNDKDQKFFESLGFKRVEPRGPKSFGFEPTLEIQGSGMFGMLEKEEWTEICYDISDEYGTTHIEGFIPD